jgi:hypothetical protein
LEAFGRVKLDPMSGRDHVGIPEVGGFSLIRSSEYGGVPSGH